MDPVAAAEAARLLVDARRTGAPLAQLPSHCRPANAADVNSIVDRVTQMLVEQDGEVIVGWKIGFLYSPRQPPMICPLFASRVFRSPAQVPRSVTDSRLIEPEIAFRLQADLPGRPKPYRPEEVAEVLTACASLEMIDTRFDTSRRSIRQMIDDRSSRLDAMADHNTTGAYITAEDRADWQDFDFSAMRVTMGMPGRVLVETVGGHAFSDPFLPTVVLANAMRHRGGMRRGDLLVTGSFSGFFEVESNVPVTATFEGFGTVQATFAEH